MALVLTTYANRIALTMYAVDPHTSTQEWRHEGGAEEGYTVGNAAPPPSTIRGLSRVHEAHLLTHSLLPEQFLQYCV